MSVGGGRGFTALTQYIRYSVTLTCLPIVLYACVSYNSFGPCKIGLRTVDKYRLYDPNVPTNIHNRCCTLLCYISQFILHNNRLRHRTFSYISLIWLIYSSSKVSQSFTQRSRPSARRNH
jgi:hypothetical protein